MIKGQKLIDAINNSNLSYGAKLTTLSILKDNEIIGDFLEWCIMLNKNNNVLVVANYFGSVENDVNSHILKKGMTQKEAMEMKYHLEEALNNNGKTI